MKKNETTKGTKLRKRAGKSCVIESEIKEEYWEVEGKEGGEETNREKVGVHKRKGE